MTGRPAVPEDHGVSRAFSAALLLLLLPACRARETTVLLRVRATPAVIAPDELRLSVYADQAEVEDRRLPACEGCALRLPSELVLYPRQSSGELRVLVRARRALGTIGEGVARVALVPGAQVVAEVLIGSGSLPDGDADGVPDAIDRCPALPNPRQGPCVAPDARPDVPPPRDLHLERRERGADLPKADLKKPDLAKADLAKPDLAKPDLKKPDLKPLDLAAGGDLSGTRVCGTADENTTLSLSCTAPLVIRAVLFASYGTPTGSCGSFAVSACDAAGSTAVVTSACLGLGSCSVGADNATFGDPCVGTFKWLAVEVTCAP